VDLPDAVGHPAFPSTLESLIRHHGGSILDIARESLEREDVLEFEVPDPRLLAPVLPSSIRAFETFRTRGRRAGRFPLYSRWEHRAVLGPDEELPWPAFTTELDFEGQLGCVVGSGGRDLTTAEARDCVFGYLLVTGWVARDVEREEWASRSGPGKSRGFGLSVGPWVATPDDLDLGGVELELRVDSEPWGEGQTPDMRWTFPELIASASLGEDVRPGDVLASGPFAGGSGLDEGHVLRPGSTVELEGTGLGVLRTSIGPVSRTAPAP
jgi:2-keto-4-pentenoate hydratase/2-oxohepta-3-ene-1,7-dioic acid hydratase in catechol pathway